MNKGHTANAGAILPLSSAWKGAVMEDREIIEEVNRCIRMEAESVESLLSALDEDAVLRTAKAIMNCKGKVVLSGCGTSAMAAKK